MGQIISEDATNIIRKGYADWSESRRLLNILFDRGASQNKVIPLVGLWFWDPEKQRIVNGSVHNGT